MLVNSTTEFDHLKIGLASPDRIRYWSYGEVEKPETINYRTFKPERKGLFCEKIFGPVKDWECSCGKYRRVRYRGIVCERCGVEVTHSKVRRERMGHIELAAPVTHIWFLKGIPSFLGLVLDMSTRQLEEVIYYDSFIVTHVDPSVEDQVSYKELISAADMPEFKQKFKEKVKIDIGANAIKTLLANINLKQEVKQLREDLHETKGQKRLKVTKRLRVLESLDKSGNQPEWLVLCAIPIMPPDLRPMVQLEGGRFATSDLNDLYRRVVNRNNRLKRLMDIGAPDMIVRNEKRMLQEAVDVLISNGKRGRAVTGSNGRPLKSLGNIIEGKQGRFRQNLLGKRVDYSARSVIVVGPSLKSHQCGLPKEMALELFKPFVIRKLVEEGHVSNVKSAKRKIERRDVVVWGILEKVIKGQLVLLNRAPTLHRLGIQAFEPILVEGSAIQIHPLVCTAFNADFDGDQMAVHVPLSVEAQAECRLLIMATNNVLSASSGRAIITPTQDMILGCYFLTVDDPESLVGKGKAFSDFNEARRAHESKVIQFQTLIKVRVDGKFIDTTIGRIIFNSTISEAFAEFGIEYTTYVNHIIGKSQLGELVYQWYITYGNEVASLLCDRLKSIGFKYSTLSGISISIDDLTIPSTKQTILDEAQAAVEKLTKQEKAGKLSTQEYKSRSIDIWRSATQRVSDALENEMGRLNNVFIMANSGARGNMDQVRQLAGMRGLMSDSQGRTVDIPIRTNFKEGLSLTEYFISAYGARKGLVDTALRTADSGYLTRRLVDVAQDVMITIEDCGTEEGVEMKAIIDGTKALVSLSDMLEGRVANENVVHPISGKIIIAKGEEITRKISQEIQAADITSVKTRSVYHCQAIRGLCQKCYGTDLSTAKMVNLGEAVGIIAAQSIGEPGTQLTMRTFHTGGVDLRKASMVEIRSLINGIVEFDSNITMSPLKGEDGVDAWVIIKEGSISVANKTQTKHHFIPVGTKILVKAGDKITADQLLAQYDPILEYDVAEVEGVVHLLGQHLEEHKGSKGKFMYYVANNSGSLCVYDPKKFIEIQASKEIADQCVEGQRVTSDILNNKDLMAGGLIMKKTATKEGKKKSEYTLQVAPGQVYSYAKGAKIYAKGDSKVVPGDILIEDRVTEAEAGKTQDIVQGLPRVEELFEARKPKDAAVLSEIDGIVDIVNHEFHNTLYVTSEDGKRKEYKLPKDSKLRVYAGKRVMTGDQLNSGGVNPHDISETKGITAAQQYLSEEVQRVYRSQGVSINTKHIEVIVRQMTRKISITDMGDSTFLINELIDMRTLNRVNEALVKDGKEPAKGTRLLLGITRSSLNTESFISASSFQQTASVLTRAAIEGQKDPMLGLKENVIIGKLIPAGTGLNIYSRVGLKVDQDESQEEVKKIEFDYESASVGA